MKEGEKIWVESLLSEKEYSNMSKTYPNTYSKGSIKPAMFDCEFKWRCGMGAPIPADEIERFNSTLDALLKSKGLIKTYATFDNPENL